MNGCSRLATSLFEPTLFLPGIQISGLWPDFPWNEVRTFHWKYSPISVGLRPAKFDLPIAVCAINIKLVTFRVALLFEYFIFFRFRSRVIFCKLAEVASLNFIASIFLNFLFKLKLPGVIIFERPPFLPAFSIRASQGCPNVSHSQTLTTACFTGELPGLVIVNCVPPSFNYPYRIAFILRWEVPGQTRKINDPATCLALTFSSALACCLNNTIDQDQCLCSG